VAHKRQVHANKCINRGRIFVLIFILSTLVAFLTFLLCLHAKSTFTDEERDAVAEKVSFVFATLFVTEFVILTTLIGFLTCFLIKKKRIIHKGASTPNFRSGICILVTIVLIFNLSYPFRVLNDYQVIYISESAPVYQQMMYDLFLGIPYDLIPILLILCLHRRNLGTHRRNVLHSECETNSALDFSLTTETETAGKSEPNQLANSDGACNDTVRLTLDKISD